MTAPHLELRRTKRSSAALVLFGVTSVGLALEGGLFAVLQPLRKGTHVHADGATYIVPVSVKPDLYWRPLRLERLT